jgi:hypothetical protein
MPMLYLETFQPLKHDRTIPFHAVPFLPAAFKEIGVALSPLIASMRRLWSVKPGYDLLFEIASMQRNLLQLRIRKK